MPRLYFKYDRDLLTELCHYAYESLLIFLREALSQYIIRNTFSLEKMSYIEETGTVIYHSRMSRGKNKKNFQMYQAEEFIAAITQHIPEKSFQICAELVSVWYATTDSIQINPGGYARNRVSRDLVKHLKQDLRMTFQRPTQPGIFT